MNDKLTLEEIQIELDALVEMGLAKIVGYNEKGEAMYGVVDRNIIPFPSDRTEKE